MELEHHRDLAHEFPELRHRIREFKLESATFRQLYAEYQAPDNEVYRIEQDIEAPADDYQEWRNFAHDSDELVTVVEGRLEVLMHSKSWALEPGDELDIPRGVVHTVRNTHDGDTRWLYGYVLRSRSLSGSCPSVRRKRMPDQRPAYD